MSVLHGTILGMTPIWVTLLVAGLGLIGTVGGAIGGVLITQRSAEKREAAARQLEATGRSNGGYVRMPLEPSTNEEMPTSASTMQMAK
jgi:hypothetical protein